MCRQVFSRETKHSLWESVKFHTGGKAHERTRVICRAPEQVRFLRRRLQSGWERILNMMNQSAQANRSYVRRLVVTAVLSALSGGFDVP